MCNGIFIGISNTLVIRYIAYSHQMLIKELHAKIDKSRNF